MREQTGFLENVTDRSLMRFKRFSRCIILPHLITDHEASRQAIQTRHASQNGGFATPRGSK
jgi:hypothetical protein